MAPILRPGATNVQVRRAFCTRIQPSSEERASGLPVSDVVLCPPDGDLGRMALSRRELPAVERDRAALPECGLGSMRSRGGD